MRTKLAVPRVVFQRWRVITATLALMAVWTVTLQPRNLGTPEPRNPGTLEPWNGEAEQDLPVGTGRDVVATRCVSCHQADLITQQRLTRAGWGRTVDKMVRWGATVAAEEREPMLDYLSAHFAPKPAASHLVATAGSEALYKRACLTCHEDDLIESQRLSRAGWVREVDKMIRWGANVAPTDKDALVDYLAARYPPR